LEEVLTIRTSDLIENFHLCKDISKIMPFIENSEFRKRNEIEEDTNFLQLIPYIILKNDNKFFVTERIGGEKRLIGGYSIGLGGHINPCDTNGIHSVYECIKRELLEEVGLFSNEYNNSSFSIIINTNENIVDAVHIGLVFFVETKKENIEIKEKTKLKGSWVEKKDLKNFYEKFESWSKIVFDNVIDKEI